MNRKLSTIKVINLVFLILLAVHLPIRTLCWQAFGMLLFSEMYYVTVISVGLALQFKWEADSKTDKAEKWLRYAGAVLLVYIAVTAIVISMETNSEGVLYFDEVRGREIYGCFAPLLVIGDMVHLITKAKKTRNGFDKASALLCAIIYMIYFVHAVMARGNYGYMWIISFADRLVIYLPTIVLVRVVIWLARQFTESIQMFSQKPSD